MMDEVWQYLQAAGWLAAPLALTTFAIWFKYFMILDALRSKLRTLETKNAEFTEHISQAMNGGESFTRAFEAEKMKILSGFAGALTTITALVAAAPLLGLLGTVQGIIETFIAISGDAGTDAQQFGGGIGRALLTTQIGLSAAIPGTFAVAHLKRVYHQLQNSLGLRRAQLYLKLKQV